MSKPPARPARDGATETADQRARQIGLQAVMRLAATMRIGRSYSTDNHVFQQQLDALLVALTPLLE